MKLKVFLLIHMKLSSLLWHFTVQEKYNSLQNFFSHLDYSGEQVCFQTTENNWFLNNCEQNSLLKKLGKGRQLHTAVFIVRDIQLLSLAPSINVQLIALLEKDLKWSKDHWNNEERCNCLFLDSWLCKPRKKCKNVDSCRTSRNTLN